MAQKKPGIYKDLTPQGETLVKICSFAGIAAGCAVLWITPLSGVIAGVLLGVGGSIAGMTAGRFIAVAAGQTRQVNDFN